MRVDDEALAQVVAEVSTGASQPRSLTSGLSLNQSFCAWLLAVSHQTCGMLYSAPEYLLLTGKSMIKSDLLLWAFMYAVVSQER